MDINLNDFPPYSTVCIVRNGQRMNVNTQDYVATDGDEIVMVLTPADRAALAPLSPN